jgi:hypothetical protein
MTSNNQVSSMLLLVLIGLAIYFLCYPDQASETKPKEFFEDLSLDNSNKQTADILGNMQDSTLYSSPSQPIVSNNVIQEIINSPEPTVQPVVKPVVQPPVQPVVQPPVKEIKQNNNQPIITDFTANDDNDSDFGTELNSAFAAPLPPGTNPEVVNFKKVNNDNYNAKDFLPKQINDEWFETDFSLAKYQLNDDKLINTERYMIGINTVGQSLKNATYDIRGTIANPKLVVSPWNNSTYEPDFNLKPLC